MRRHRIALRPPRQHGKGLRRADITRSDDALSQAVWARVAAGPGCWEWTGPKDPDDRGHCWTGKEYARVSRVVFVLVYGDIPPGLCVLHTCDNPSCVRPDHLWLGTQADNLHDMRAKGRAAWQRTA